MTTNDAKTHTMILKTLHALMTADIEQGEFAERLAVLEAQLDGN